MRNSIIKYAASIALCFVCASIGILITGYAPSSPVAMAADAAVLDISGPWTSQFGTIMLKVEGKDSDGQIVISGSWNNGGSTGEIVYGRFAPATAGGVLKLEYYVAGRKLYGYAEFKLDAARTAFNGKYHEAGQEGAWVLSRPKGFVPSYLNSIANVTSLGRNKRSPVLTNVVGIWDSTFGPVELQSTGYSLGVLVSGKFTRPDGKVGKIVSGSYIRDGRGGLLKIQYETPWNKAKGSGTFRPVPNLADRQLEGIFTESGQTGQWILSRPLPK